MKTLQVFLAALMVLGATSLPAADRVVYEGTKGPGRGKHIVFLSGDEEYRSEEALPMLAKILAVHHGFKCTVLFPLNPVDGTIDPNNQTHVVGLEAIQTADLVIMLLRFREFPDAQMKYFVDYYNAGKPIIGLRTSTHAFSYERNKKSPYAKFDWRSKEWPGGFGQQVLGDTWISHHGNHGSQSTRGIINEQLKQHPILKGVTDIWGPSDVYGITHLPADAQVLAYGQILSGMKPTDAAIEGPKNNPMMPLIWARERKNEVGKVNRILCSTIGAASDFESEGLRRLMVNASYWCLGMEKKIKASSKADVVGEYHPTFFGFGKFKKGMKPSDYELKSK